VNNDITIGMDLGNKQHVISILGGNGEVLEQVILKNTREEVHTFFECIPEGTSVVMEAGTPSCWIGNMLTQMGLRVVIGNPRKVRAIWDTTVKTDTRDSEMLARIGRFDEKLLGPIAMQNQEMQADLSIIKQRDMIVDSRTAFINNVIAEFRKAGVEVPHHDSTNFCKVMSPHIPKALKPALGGIMEIIAKISLEIKKYQKKIDALCRGKYAEQTSRLTQITGVGNLTALTVVLIIGDPERFTKRRNIGAYAGLVPKCDKSGDTDKQLRISKAGNRLLRYSLCNAAKYILYKGPDTNLRRFGERLIERGGRNAKSKAVVAVARKLSVLMLKLLVTGDKYEPLKSDAKCYRGKSSRPKGLSTGPGGAPTRLVGKEDFARISGLFKNNSKQIV